MQVLEQDYNNSIKFLLYAIAFLTGLFLVLQIRYTFSFDSITGEYFEYGSLHLYLSHFLLFLIFLYGLIARRLTWNLNTFEWLWLGWIVWQTITILWSADPLKSGWVALTWWILLGGYLVLKGLSQTTWKYFRYGLVASVVILAGVAVAQFWVNSSLGLGLLGESPLNPAESGVSVIETDIGRQLRAYGLVPHPNILGGVLLIIAWLSFNISLWILFGFLVIFALFLTMSRSGLLAGFISWLIAWKIEGWKETLKKISGFVGIAVLVLGIIYPSVLTARLKTGNYLETKSIKQRSQSLEFGIRVARHNFFLGVGAGAAAQKLAENQPGQPAGVYQPPHNIFILQTAEAGVLGIILLLLFLLFLIRFMYLNGKWLGLSALSVWIIFGLFDHFPLSLYQGMALLWVILVFSQAENSSKELDKQGV